METVKNFGTVGSQLKLVIVGMESIPVLILEHERKNVVVKITGDEEASKYIKMVLKESLIIQSDGKSQITISSEFDYHPKQAKKIEAFTIYIPAEDKTKTSLIVTESSVQSELRFYNLTINSKERSCKIEIGSVKNEIWVNCFSPKTEVTCTSEGAKLNASVGGLSSLSCEGLFQSIRINTILQGKVYTSGEVSGNYNASCLEGYASHNGYIRGEIDRHTSNFSFVDICVPKNSWLPQNLFCLIEEKEELGKESFPVYKVYMGDAIFHYWVGEPKQEMRQPLLQKIGYVLVF